MKSVVRNIMYAAISSAVLFTATSCEDDRDAELLAIPSDRLLSVVDLEVKVRNKVEIVVSWVKNAQTQSYDLELYQGTSATGAPVQTANTVENTYTFKGLLGEETYYVQVKGVSSSLAGSKWMGDFVTTDAEQMMYEVDLANDVKAHEATVRWPEGEAADSVIWSTDGAEVGRRVVTADEIAAGALTLTDLKDEKTYKVILRKSGRTRGSVSFTTLLDLGGAVAVSPEDDYLTMLSEAEEGAIFAFYGGEYANVTTDDSGNEVYGTFTLSKSVTIKAVKGTDRPVFKGRFVIEGDASFTIQQAVVDCAGTSGDQAFVIKSGNHANITIDDCEIMNSVKGFYYINEAATVVDVINVNNCLIHGIECNGGDMFDCRTGAIKELNITNNTIWNSCAARDMVRYDDKSADYPDVAPVINILNNTMDGVCNDASKRLLYIRFAGNVINFKNNIVSNTVGHFSNQSKTSVPAFENNNYFNATGFHVTEGEGSNANAKMHDTSGSTNDPQYKDAAKGDFTIGNFDVSDKKQGAPCWLP
jgi:hypothetical protein